MPQTVVSEAKRSKDRHAPRRTIAYKPDVYLLLKHLAQTMNKRPLIWEAELIAISHLEAAGLWPADQALLKELRRKDEEGEE